MQYFTNNLGFNGLPFLLPPSGKGSLLVIAVVFRMHIDDDLANSRTFMIVLKLTNTEGLFTFTETTNAHTNIFNIHNPVLYRIASNIKIKASYTSKMQREM